MRTLALLLSTLALVAAGCGGDDEAATDTATTEAQPTETATEAATEDAGSDAAGEPVEIAMRDIKFDPVEAEAAVGQTVIWTNEDSAPHNVIGGPIESPTFNQGETFEYTPEEAGTIDYVCTIHPGMEGTLTVTDG
jgi:plastocyanin